MRVHSYKEYDQETGAKRRRISRRHRRERKGRNLTNHLFVLREVISVESV